MTPTHLAIVMEYAAGGELFERICNAGRFSEDEVYLLIHSLTHGHIHFGFEYTPAYERLLSKHITEEKLPGVTDSLMMDFRRLG